MVNIILRLEGLTVFISAIVFYWLDGRDWLTFILLILVPDISLLGYAINKKLGAVVYNVFHNYIIALAILLLGWGFQNEFVSILGVIFFAHIGIDRFFGFGLKYFEDFKKTHIQKI